MRGSDLAIGAICQKRKKWSLGLIFIKNLFQAWFSPKEFLSGLWGFLPFSVSSHWYLSMQMIHDFNLSGGTNQRRDQAPVFPSTPLSSLWMNEPRLLGIGVYSLWRSLIGFNYLRQRTVNTREISIGIAVVQVHGQFVFFSDIKMRRKVPSEGIASWNKTEDYFNWNSFVAYSKRS